MTSVRIFYSPYSCYGRNPPPVLFFFFVSFVSLLFFSFILLPVFIHLVYFIYVTHISLATSLHSCPFLSCVLFCSTSYILRFGQLTDWPVLVPYAWSDHHVFSRLVSSCLSRASVCIYVEWKGGRKEGGRGIRRESLADEIDKGLEAPRGGGKGALLRVCPPCLAFLSMADYCRGETVGIESC